MLQPPPSVFIKARRRFRSKYIYMCSLHKSTSCGVNCPRCSDRVQGRTMFSGPRGAVGLCRSAGITIRRLIQRHLEYNIGQIQHVLEAGDGDDLNNIPPSHTSSRTATKPRTKTHKRKPLFSNPSPPPPSKTGRFVLVLMRRYSVTSHGVSPLFQLCSSRSNPNKNQGKQATRQHRQRSRPISPSVHWRPPLEDRNTAGAHSDAR